MAEDDRAGSTGGPVEEKPHFHGHRRRLRERFLTAGPDALADYELLELLLFLANPRGDVKPLAKRLIQRFGSFADAIAQVNPGMMETISDHAACRKPIPTGLPRPA